MKSNLKKGLGLVGLISATALGGTARLEWDNYCDTSEIEYTLVYHSCDMTNWTVYGQSTSNSLPLSALKSGAHFFYATNVGTNGFESDPSNQVRASVVTPPITKIVIER